MTKLYVQDSAGFREAGESELMEEAQGCIRKKLVRGLKFTSPDNIKEHLPILLGGRDYECFNVAFLDGSGGLIAFEEMFKGTSDQVQVHIRPIMRRAIELNAEVLALVHNHPSGNTKASDPDIATTARVIAAAQLFDMGVCDHFIVAGTEVGSLREQGGIKPERIMQAILGAMLPDARIEMMGVDIKPSAPAKKKKMH